MKRPIFCSECLMGIPPTVLVLCARCKAPHHRPCWGKYSGCAVCYCLKNTNEDESADYRGKSGDRFQKEAESENRFYIAILIGVILILGLVVHTATGLSSSHTTSSHQDIFGR